MKTNLFKIIAIFFAMGLFVVSSCKKPDPDAQSAEDDARGSFIMADAFALGNDNAGGGGGGKLGGCMTRENIDENTVKLSFSNCDYRGHTRNGAILIDYSHLLTMGERAFHLVITFENYSVDGIGVTGTISTTFQGPYTAPVIKVKARNMVATFGNGETIQWSSDKTFTIANFLNLDNPNIVTMSGTANGTNRSGETYKSTYSNVKVDRSCELGYPVSGTVTIESDKGTTVIDYGNGNCDNEITVTNGGVSVNVKL